MSAAVGQLFLVFHNYYGCCPCTPDLGFVLEDRFLEVGISGCEGCKAVTSSTCTLGAQKAVPFHLCPQVHLSCSSDLLQLFPLLFIF